MKSPAPPVDDAHVAPVPLEWASPVQEAIFRYGPYPLCASGGFGTGKTYALCHKALWLSDKFPRNRGVIFRRVAKELRQTTMATFFKICAGYQPPKAGSVPPT